MEINYEKIESGDFHDLNLTITNQYIVGITGNEKNELINIITLQNKIRGNIIYNNIKVTNNNINFIRKEISIVEKYFMFSPYINTVREYMENYIKEYLLIIKNTTKKIADSLKIVGLNIEILNRNLYTLSSSELKLIQIATSLLSNPNIIILEEPFINFDKKNEKKIIIILNKLKDQFKKTIILVDNNSNILYKYTQYVFFIKSNKILLQGLTKEAYSKVEILKKNKFEIPETVEFTYKAKKEKNVYIDYHRDIRDVIKDIYKHV